MRAGLVIKRLHLVRLGFGLGAERTGDRVDVVRQRLEVDRGRADLLLGRVEAVRQVTARRQVEACVVNRRAQPWLIGARVCLGLPGASASLGPSAGWPCLPKGAPWVPLSFAHASGPITRSCGLSRAV